MNKFAIALQHKKELDLVAIFIYTSELTSEFNAQQEVNKLLTSKSYPIVGTNSGLFMYEDYKAVACRRL